MSYHMRRMDRAINSVELLKLLLGKATHVTLAMADAGEPYAVPLSHSYDPDSNTVYFHCAKEGRKLDILKKNPRVWGLAVLDRGFDSGQCENLYASVMFGGSVEFVEDRAEKLGVLRMQARKNSGDVEGVLKRLDAAAVAAGSGPGVVFGKVRVESLTG